MKSNPYDTDSESFIFLWSFMSSYLFLTFYTALLPVTKLPKTISKIAKTIGSLVDDVKTGVLGFAAKVVATSTVSKVSNLISRAIATPAVVMQASRLGLLKNIKSFISHPQRTINHHLLIYDKINELTGKGKRSASELTKLENGLDIGLRKLDNLDIPELKTIFKEQDALGPILSELATSVDVRKTYPYVVYVDESGGVFRNSLFYAPGKNMKIKIDHAVSYDGINWKGISTKSTTSPPERWFQRENPGGFGEKFSFDAIEKPSIENALKKLLESKGLDFGSSISIDDVIETRLYGPTSNSVIRAGKAADFLSLNIEVVELMNDAINLGVRGYSISFVELQILYPPHDEQSPNNLALVAVSSLLAALGIGIWGWRRKRMAVS